MIFHHPGNRWRAGVGTVAGVAALGALLLLLGSGPARAAESPVNLGTAADFSVLAGSQVSNTGATTLAQGLGVHPGAAATGFPPGIVAGETHLANGVALQAKSDLTTAYLDAAGRTPFTSLPAELGGSTLTPGVYRIGAAQLTGQLTLNSQNDPAAVFIFQISSTLVTASNSDVIFINGASPCNVFWQVTSSATLGTNSDFVGNIMALTSITMNTGATLAGRALARNAAVTLDDNVITAPVCAAATTAPATTAPATTAPATTPATPATTAATTTPATSPVTTPAVGPTGTGVPTAGPPIGVPPTTVPAVATPTGTATSTDTPAARPPRLPTTGSGAAPALAAAGSMLVVVGAVILLRSRRRNTTP